MTGSDRPRTFVSDMYTACLARAPHEGPIGTWWARGEERAVSSGAVLLAEPGEAQYLKSADGPASFFFVCIAPSIVARMAAELGLADGLRWKTPFLDAGRHSDLLARVAATVHAPDDSLSFIDAFNEATTELVSRNAELGPPRRTGNANHPGIRRAMERLASNFREPSSLDDLAKEARLSKFHFVRCFRQATGLSPHRYRKLLRVLEARRLLEHGMSVAEAAGQASFADASHLSRTFREWLGVTPGLWANAWRASEPSEQSAPRTMPPPQSSSEPLPASGVG
ncbi:MAG TPA: AraC family transcriptional regulator [Polyangiaceae bacterium]|jgi:AraC family chemosensory pili system transcriptional regulator ChpD|nr:AraC family transcriptional regulator [Polyangiaceae bacterium]